MASSKIEIWNDALAYIGSVSTIEGVEDGTTESDLMVRIWDRTRDQALERFNWSFARKVASLVATTHTETGWEYVYMRPVDCLMPRRILPVNPRLAHDPVPYATGKIGSTLVIYTNYPDAELEYTERIGDQVSLYSAGFEDALALSLAAKVSIPLSTSSSEGGMSQFREASYWAFIQAQADDLEGQEMDAEPEAEYIRDRA